MNNCKQYIDLILKDILREFILYLENNELPRDESPYITRNIDRAINEFLEKREQENDH